MKKNMIWLCAPANDHHSSVKLLNAGIIEQKTNATVDALM